MKKEFILRTESVLSSEKATQAFDGDNDVTIPMCILEDLYRYQGNPEKKIIASKFIDYIKDMNFGLLYSESGVKQKNGSTLRVIDNSPICEKVQKLNHVSELDKRAFQVCLDRMERAKRNNEKIEIVLISQNPTILMKAISLGIKAEPHKDEIFPAPKDQYTGKVEIPVAQSVIDAFMKNGKIKKESIYGHEKVEWVENIFVIFQSVETSTRIIGRYTQGKIVKLKYQSIDNFKPANEEQAIALECLLAPPNEASLVIIKGAAGTGKTYESLCAGLAQLARYANNGKYSQILVGAPTVTLDEDLGYLPGDIDQKVGPYLGGIYDNLKDYFEAACPESDNRETYDRIHELFDRQFIDIQPIGFIRGRSISKTYIILDEIQNAEPSTMKHIITRTGKNTKFILIGDSTQISKPELTETRNGLVYASEKMKGNHLCWQITFDSEKSLRSELAQEALKIL